MGIPAGKKYQGAGNVVHIFPRHGSSNLRSSLREALAEAARQGDFEVADALRRMLVKIGSPMGERQLSHNVRSVAGNTPATLETPVKLG